MRESGYYWVRFLGNPNWMVIYYEDPYVYNAGDECMYTTLHLEEIDERKIVREEPLTEKIPTGNCDCGSRNVDSTFSRILHYSDCSSFK